MENTKRGKNRNTKWLRWPFSFLYRQSLLVRSRSVPSPSAFRHHLPPSPDIVCSPCDSRRMFSDIIRRGDELKRLRFVANDVTYDWPRLNCYSRTYFCSLSLSLNLFCSARCAFVLIWRARSSSRWKISFFALLLFLTVGILSRLLTRGQRILKLRTCKKWTLLRAIPKTPSRVQLASHRTFEQTLKYTFVGMQTGEKNRSRRISNK